MGDDAELKRIACEAIDSQTSYLRILSQDIWNHPELCFNEQYAHKRLTDFLEERDFNVERSYKLETAFRAVPKYSRCKEEDGYPNIAILCEYDALPGIGHACGHNLIAMVGVAASLGVQAALQSSAFQGRGGRLMVLGTPAEEGGGGKIELIRAGAFEDVDVAMMAHPSQHNLSNPVYLAMKEVAIIYTGKASHASGAPWDGINALDAAVQCYTNISHLRQQIKPTWRVHGVIINGGLKPNIIPDQSELLYYLRAPTVLELDVLTKKVTDCIHGAAQATGCQVEIKLNKKPYSNLLSNNTLASLYIDNGEKMGIQFEKDPEKTQKAGGSTDMGNVSHVVPSIHPKFFIDTTASLHSKDFATVAYTEKAETLSLKVAKALAMTAIDVLITPGLADKIKDEFKVATEAEKACR
ncbi:hypothetical protein C0Q70_11737 [Pomacea canaliculata]|uniref:Peptidase M20 domain-containing protein 2 n=1 Tax=Pomacea canaliculata TaxID=400727 RepID=A0A2T7P6U0_POMCA|nr:peptidase M20 domain-containing protein 2-like [Pomacea canaliculata]PVD29140.1 hypothetical protein C0Q70_11737 [Pomacea canaliculata]